MESILVLTALLFVKHFFADGPFQTSYQVSHKGRFLHPGGLAHAGVHVAGTALCIGLWVSFAAPAGAFAGELLNVIVGVLAMEFVLHYLIDYGKCQADARYRFSEVRPQADGVPRLVINSSMFFMSFLLDQLAHALTMLLIVYLIVTSL